MLFPVVSLDVDRTLQSVESDPQKKYREQMLELAKHSVSFLFFALDCSTHKLAFVVTRQ